VSGTIGGLPAVFHTTYPAGTAPAGAASGAASGGAAGDVVDIRVPLPAGVLSVRAGDSLSVRELFGSPRADLMRVALRGEGGGRLLLRGEDVTARVDFEPMEYNELLFVAGEAGSVGEVVAVARTVTRGAAGTPARMADSAPSAILLRVGGARSVEAAAALRTLPDAADGDAAFLRVAQEGAIHAPFAGRTAPALSTVGNVTLKAGDTVALRDLFSAGKGAEAAVMRVALRADPAAPGGRLMLDGADVTGRTDFTPMEFNALQFVAGPAGGAQDILVVARAGRRDAGGVLRDIVDSPAVAITAAATGVRSANAAPALRTLPGAGDGDAGYLRLAQEAAVFAPLGGRKAPAVAPAGDVTVKAGDTLSVRDLFPAGRTVEAALYRVAIRDDPAGPAGGRLVLNGEDVTGRVDFTPLEFNSLGYVAGPAGGAQELMVVARAGTPDGRGGLTGIADSPPALLRADVTGTRSLGAAGALRTAIDPDAADADFMGVAAGAALRAPLGNQAAPKLLTAGNFTAAPGDRFALRDLFVSPYDAAIAIDSYRVAIRDEDAALGARLILDGEDVTRRVGFTPAEFNTLVLVAGAAGGATDLVVAARRKDAAGLAIDSRAVAITARVTGERSVNALPALRGAAPDDAFARLAGDAAVFAPLGGRAAPALRAVGDFTAAGGDLFSMNTLFDTAGGSFAAGASYRVATRADAGGALDGSTAGGSTAGGGRLLLNGEDVTARTSFSGAEFAALLFEAGPAGSAADLMVVARLTDAAGRVTDGPATEITARATGARSLNALPALRTPGAGEAGFDRVVRDAAVHASPAAPALLLAARPDRPAMSVAALSAAVGAYRATGGAGAAGHDLSALFGDLVGASRTTGAASARLAQLSSLVAALGGGTVGGVRTTGVDLAKGVGVSLR